MMTSSTPLHMHDLHFVFMTDFKLHVPTLGILRESACMDLMLVEFRDTRDADAALFYSRIWPDMPLDFLAEGARMMMVGSLRLSALFYSANRCLRVGGDPVGCDGR